MKRVLLSLFALTATMYACQNPVENVDVGLKETLPTNVELRFKSLTGVAPKSVTVRVTGPDADKVVTILNTKNFRVDEDGVLKLATVESVAPDSEHPLRFTVVATADGFMEVVRPITLSDNNQRMVPITMPGNKANGGIVEMTAQSDARGSFKTTLTLQTSEAGNAAIQATVTIPAGALLKDALYKPVDGGLTVRMQPVVVNSAADLPSSGLLASAATTPGEVDGAQQLTNIAGAVTLEIHNSDYKTVKTFSVPVRMVFAVNQQTVNPATGEQIKPGNAIPMFSYDAATDQWQQEAEGLIQKNARTGQLECVAQLPHLSTWVAAFRKQVCKEGVTFEVKSNFKDYDAPFYCQVLYVNRDGLVKAVAASFYRTLIDDSEISVTNLDQDGSVILRVYENPANLTKFITSPVVKACKGETKIDVRSLKIPATAQAMTFTIQFPCQNVNEKILPERVVAQFRPAGTSGWQDLVTLDRKDIKKDLLRGTTYKATRGQRYDLRVKVLGFNFEQPNQLIDKNDWLVKIRGKEFCKK